MVVNDGDRTLAFRVHGVRYQSPGCKSRRDLLTEQRGGELKHQQGTAFAAVFSGL